MVKMKNKFFLFIKYSLFLINLLYMVAGLAIIGLGMYLRINGYKVLTHITTENVYIFPLIIVFGCIVFLIALSGSWGAISEVKCLLITFIVCTLLLAVAIIAAVVVMFIYQTKLLTLAGQFVESQKNSDDFVVLESWAKCCGTTGPHSYQQPNKTLSLPQSCCSIDTYSNTTNMQTCVLADAFREGCIKIVELMFTEYTNTAGYSLIMIALFTVISMLSGIYLCYSKYNKKTYT